jgi:hypothetical protein
MNEVEIPLKITGIAELKAELRGLQGAIASATDPEQVAQLSMQAGELRDRIKDANEAVNVFASGSKFEQVSNSLGGIKDSLMSLDFEEAQQKAQVFSQIIGNLNPGEIAKSFKGFMGVLSTMGGAFVKLGMTILANPIFLLVAAITAIVVAIGFFLKKIGVLDAVLSAIMAPINLLIEGFKALTDWLGLTTYAEEENAEAVKKAEEEKRVAIDDTFNARKSVFNLTKDMSNEEIKQLEDRLGIAIQTLDSEYDIEEERLTLRQASLEEELASLQAIEDAGGELTDEQIKQRDDLYKSYKETNTAIEENERQRAKAIIDINRKQDEVLRSWKLKNIQDENQRAKEQFKIDEQTALAEIDKQIRLARSLNQDVTKFEQTKVEIKQFYATEAQKVDQRVAKQAQDAQIAANKQAQDAAKQQQAEYEKRIEKKLRDLKEANQKEINLTQEGTQARVDAEKKAFDIELEYLKKNQGTFKLTKDQLFNIEVEYDKKKRKLQDDFDKKQKQQNNQQFLAEAENNLLSAEGEIAKFDASIKLLEAKAAVELDNAELTATQKENIELKLANDIKEITKTKTDFQVAEAKKLVEAEALRAQTALDAAKFDAERFKGTVDQQRSLQENLLESALTNLEKQKALELENKDLTEEQKAAIEEKYRQAKQVAEEESTAKINAINAKQVSDSLEYTTMGLQATQQLTEMFFSFRKRKLKEGTKEAEKAARQEFAIQKAFNLGMAVIDGAKAITSILAQYPKFDGGFAMAAALASAGIASVVNIGKIASAQFEGGGGAPTAPDIPTGGFEAQTSTGGMATPNVSLFGSANQLNNVGNPNQEGGNNITVTAVVSETEMTNTQNRINKIQRNAEL